MAVSVAVTEETHGSVKKIQWTWTAAADGTLTGGGSALTTSNEYSGKVEALVTEPGASAPSVNYDITVSDDDSYDVLAGGGADRSDSATETVLASSLGIVANSKLTIAVAAAGDGGQGVTTVYIR